MNIFSLFPLFSLVSTFILAFYVLLLNWKSYENRIFAVFLSMAAFWSFSNFLVFTANSVQEALTYDFWGTVGSAFTGVLLFHFVLAFIKNRNVALRIFLAISYILAFFLCVIDYFTLLFKSNVVVEYWGFSYVPGPFYLVIASFVMGLSTIGLILAINRYVSLKDYSKKRQTLLLVFALFIPVFGGTITQVIFPVLNIGLFPVTTTLTAVMALIIGASITKYRMFKPKSFSIRKKILIGFFILTILSAIIGHASVSVSKQILYEQIGNHSVEIADETMSMIDTQINNQIIHWLFVSHASRLIGSTLVFSNAEFESLDNVSSYVSRANNNWTNHSMSSPCPLCEEALNSNLSDLFRSYIAFYNDKYNTSLIGEVFATNRFGAVVGQSSVVSDYDQSDEFWWQETTGKGLYVSEIYSDKSSNVSNALAVCVRVDEKSYGKFIGVLKVVLNVEPFFELIEKMDLNLQHNSSFWLLSAEGQILYSTEHHSDSSFLGKDVFGHILEDHDQKCDYFLEDDMLYAHAHSIGYGDFEGLNWMLIIQQDANSLFSPVDNLVMVVGGLTGIVFLASVVLGILFSKSISRPLISLNNEALRMSKGDLSHPVEANSDDEIGQLASSFEIMRENLHKLQVDLEDRVKKRTTELNDKVEELEKFKAVTVNRELRMIELKNKLSDLEKNKKVDGDDEL